MNDALLEQWAKQLGVANNTWAIVEVMVNKAKNYDTAVALMTGLTWRNHRAYLDRMTAAFKQYIAQYNVEMSTEDMYSWLTWYVGEVEGIPA